MNRGQGFFAGFVVLLGLVMRLGGGYAADAVPRKVEVTAQKKSIKPKQQEKLSGDGPWVASCRYWEVAHQEGSKQVETDPNKGDATNEEGYSPCEDTHDPWGITETPTSGKPRITAIIAAVPDPVHTHLALEYDRAIDALMQAGADNGFLRSFYWMPWRNQNEASPALEAGAPGITAEQRKREEQPGLVILKHFARDSEPEYPWSSYDRVIYLFIVGESPSSGMNGTQLRNALRYERELQSNQHASVLLSAKPNEMSLIGSESSGAAASLREALEEELAIRRKGPPQLQIDHVTIAGSTDTKEANDILNSTKEIPGEKAASVQYYSFGPDTSYIAEKSKTSLKAAGFSLNRFAMLFEDGTVFGESGARKSRKEDSPARNNFRFTAKDKSVGESDDSDEKPLVIRFPREISLLRNAQTKEGAGTLSVPTPYLHLTLNDPAVDDTIPHFSTGQTPISQEAALMSIQRELIRYRVQFLAIYASNVLDEIFLAKFLHRSCPDVRLMFLDSTDLLLEREAENDPYIGSISVTPYNLIGLTQPEESSQSRRAFTDSQSEAIYNSASFIFHPFPLATPNPEGPILAGYQGPRTPRPDGLLHSSLWSTLVGNDGYYPLGLLSHCGSSRDLSQESQTDFSLPAFRNGIPRECEENTNGRDELQQRGTDIYPSLLWTVISIILGLYCSGHAIVLGVAWFWSPFTRDIAIEEMAEPQRRSVYMNVGAVMLFLMTFVLEVPAFRVGPAFHLNVASFLFASCSLIAGLTALLLTFWKTFRFLRMPEWKKIWSENTVSSQTESKRASYLFFNLTALFALIAVPFAWWHICSIDQAGGMDTKYGMFFSYRCLYPGSQVSPVVPVFLVLLSWYLWAICQTYRLRFSEVSRPRLPKNPGGMLAPIYPSDESLGSLAPDTCSMKRSFHLYENITCLLITREIVRRFAANKHRRRWASGLLVAVYIALFLSALGFCIIKSVDRILLAPGARPTVYEQILAGLLMPLGFIALAGALRMIMIWGALRRGVLEPLERSPLRTAFDRVKGVGWVAMLQDTGLHLRWKDMARTEESLRQVLSADKTKTLFTEAGLPIYQKAYSTQNEHVPIVAAVRKLAKDEAIKTNERNLLEQESKGWDADDLPKEDRCASLAGIYVIEKQYAWICEAVLEAVLIPYWKTKKCGFVASEAMEVKKSQEGHATEPVCCDPEYIQMAEELLALRYVSLIRAVLGNLRYLMTFIAAVFVLALVAWNSYPFQPREAGDWVFTLFFMALGATIFVVFAQMHRDAILSRITDTPPNKLGLDFYWRIATFGAVPVLTWLAYQFPMIGSGLFRWLQPGLGGMK